MTKLIPKNAKIKNFKNHVKNLKKFVAHPQSYFNHISFNNFPNDFLK